MIDLLLGHTELKIHISHKPLILSMFTTSSATGLSIILMAQQRQEFIPMILVTLLRLLIHRCLIIRLLLLFLAINLKIIWGLLWCQLIPMIVLRAIFHQHLLILVKIQRSPIPQISKKVVSATLMIRLEKL